MNQEHQQGIRAFENCIQLFINLGRSQNEIYIELKRIGLSKEDIAKIKTGEKYITEEQFYSLADMLRGSRQLDKPLINWLDLADN